jgi:hypothetical protein
MSTAAKALVQARGKIDPWGRNFQARAEHAAMADKLNAEAKENWHNEQWHRQVAADLESTFDYGFTFDNNFGQYIEVRNVGETDRIVIRERKGMKVFWTSRGGYIEESQLTEERFTVPRDTVGFHVSEHIDKLRLNFADTIDSLVALGQQRLEAETNRRILSLAKAATPDGGDYAVSVNGLTKDVLDQAIREVRDAIRPDGSGAVPVTILGRAAIMDTILDFAGYTNEANDEIRRTGALGVYRGANLRTLDNYTDEDGASFQPGNELWVLGGNAGVFALYGGLQLKTWDENTVDYRHYRARRDMGGLIHRPEVIRRITDTSVTP